MAPRILLEILVENYDKYVSRESSKNTLDQAWQEILHTILEYLVMS